MSIPAQTTDPDPADFDLDAWIAAVDRPEADVALHNPDPDWLTRYTAAEQQWTEAGKRLALARREAADEDAERSILDEGPAEAEADVDAAAVALLALRDERDARAVIVRVRQLTPDEMAKHYKAAADAGWVDVDRIVYVVAQAIVSASAPAPGGARREIPPFSPDQLLRLTHRDTSGHEAFVAIRSKIDEISARPAVPSWPGSSTSRGTGTSSAR